MNVRVDGKIPLCNNRKLAVFKHMVDGTYWVLASNIADVIVDSEVRNSNCKLIENNTERLVPVSNVLTILSRFEVDDFEVAQVINQIIEIVTHKEDE